MPVEIFQIDDVWSFIKFRWIKKNCLFVQKKKKKKLSTNNASSLRKLLYTVISMPCIRPPFQILYNRTFSNNFFGCCCGVNYISITYVLVFDLLLIITKIINKIMTIKFTKKNKKRKKKLPGLIIPHLSALYYNSWINLGPGMKKIITTCEANFE